MKKNISVGIDIGTYHIKVVVAEAVAGQPFPRIIGTGRAESKGLRHGYITNAEDATKSIYRALYQASNAAKIDIKEAFVAVGGIGLGSHVSSGTATVTRADSEITQTDLESAIESASKNIHSSQMSNRKIIHTIPLEYKVDGKEVHGNPIGITGLKLEAKIHFITYLEHHLTELIQVIEETGVEIIDVMASPLAAGLVTVTKTEKVAGCVLANIGSETASMVIYENDLPISLEVFPIGSNDITNDIALGLKVSLDEAQDIKHDREKAQQEGIPKKKLDEIIGARLSDIFELIEAHLKKINKNQLLPAGIVITGGGSGITTIDDLAKAYLKLPSKTVDFVCGEESENCLAEHIKVKDSTWSVAFGLCVFGIHTESGKAIKSGSGARALQKMGRGVGRWFKQFLP